jgi:L-ascorbate metabolism protein UlaG (beta-lactamase superfamily)
MPVLASAATMTRKGSRLLRQLLLGLVVLFGAGLLLATHGCASFGDRPSGARLEHIRQSSAYHDGKFQNAMPTRMLKEGSTFELIRRQLIVEEERVPKVPIQVVPLTRQQLETPPASGLRVTWIGHASTLLELDGYRILTDPIWSDRCSPVSGVGPERFFPPPIPLADLPPIDAVVISHDHYDHLDMATIQALAPTGVQFFVPLGIGAHLEKWGVPTGQITELEWNQSATLRGLTLTATMARHYSGRGILHGDQTLWASWAIVGPTHRAFFSGDSGYFEGFRDIGAKYGPFDLTLVKIGAYDPLWQEIHMSPEEAVQTHMAVGGKVLVPIHWGTFNLAYHDWFEPAERTVASATKAGITLVIPRPGQPVEPAAPPALETWWRNGDRVQTP